MRHSMPNTVYHAVILEECSAPYVLGIFLTAQAALDRLAAEQRKFNPNCKEECWLYVLTCKDGEVIARRDVPVIESQRNEVYATA